MSLLNQVQVARRFQRSIRIDTDLHDPKALEGFICPKSSADVLLTMAGHIQKTNQAAFTWTGPYGSGKSSLVVALSAALNGNAGLRDEAAATLGKSLIIALWDALPPKTKGWRILPVVGQRAKPAEVIGAALIAKGYVEKGQVRRWTDDVLLETLMEIANDQPRSHGGLVIFLDEMGKFLEGAAHDGEDIFLFQRLAETAARSNGRLIVVGILHQAFDEYAQRLSRELRDEWTKVQGRFVDLVVSVAGDEQLDLLSRAITSDHSKIKKPSELSSTIATIARSSRPTTASALALTLEHCWPLHPVVACLLGPISRRRFGQNQRSLFGFLNSAEPYGFQEFLRDGTAQDMFNPDRLWDYLRINLEAAILASPDGHRWAMAVEAIERCERTDGANATHASLLKTIAVLDLFRERSGLTATKELLITCFPTKSTSKIQEALKQLEKWSLVIFRKHMEAFAIYAGSDFDIEQAVTDELNSIREINFKQLRALAGLQPVLAKRHYHRTGALRWFDVDLVPLAEASSHAAVTGSDSGGMGRFLLVIPTANETKTKAVKLCQEVADLAGGDVMIGLSKMSWQVLQLAREFLALTKISEERPELSGDAVAKREVRARLSEARSRLESNLQQMFDTATWYRTDHVPTEYTTSDLNILASTIADERYSKSPRISNELLNRQKPSSNAVTAQKTLLKQMVLKEGIERLEIDGFPAEGGLFESILMNSGLYQEVEGAWRFIAPTKASDPSGLLPMWKAATAFLEKNSNRPVKISELYNIWSNAPYGVKNGLLPVLSVTFLLARRDRLAFYRDGIFQARFTSLEVDCLTNDPDSIQLRWMDLSDVSKTMLSEMAEIVRDIDIQNNLVNLEPIDVARGLVAIYESLKPWTKRTMHLSSNAIRIRNLFKQAADPNKFLFDDIPSLFGGDKTISTKQVVLNMREGLQELTRAYDVMLDRLQQMMLTELQVPNTSPQALGELRERAENIRQLSGDFRLNAFIGRLSQFVAAQSDMEGVASLATNKPARDWVDADLDQASIEIADLSQKFIRTESFARVKGRKDKRQAMSVVVGITGRPAPVSGEFSISDGERKAVDDLVRKVEKAFGDAHTLTENVILAALAEISARYLDLSSANAVKPKVKLS